MSLSQPKQYKVDVQPGNFPLDTSSSYCTGDAYQVIVTAVDGARAREIAEAHGGGPLRCRASTVGEVR